MSWVFVAVAVVSTAVSVDQSKKARRQQRRAADLAQKGARLEASRGAAEQVRQSQIARASALQQGENQGASGSTAVAGAVGSIQSQTGGNIGFANQIFGLQQSRNSLLLAASDSQGRAAGFAQLASIAGGQIGSFGSSGGANPKAPVLANNSAGGNVAPGSFVQ